MPAISIAVPVRLPAAPPGGGHTPSCSISSGYVPLMSHPGAHHFSIPPFLHPWTPVRTTGKVYMKALGNLYMGCKHWSVDMRSLRVLRHGPQILWLTSLQEGSMSPPLDLDELLTLAPIDCVGVILWCPRPRDQSSPNYMGEGCVRAT